jgi:hypothetical protein
MENSEKTEDANEMLTTEQAARYIGLKAQTLRIWRCRGDGPPYYRLSLYLSKRGPAGYRRADLERWLAERRVLNIADEKANCQPS